MAGIIAARLCCVILVVFVASCTAILASFLTDVIIIDGTIGRKGLCARVG
jgi:hypothetical protein